LLDRLGEVARGLRPRIGWNLAGVALSATVILVSGVVLYHRLRGLDWRAVAAAIEAVPGGQIAGAAFFAACGYVTLALYDWLALRTIGARQVPFRVAALTGATSYAVGHGIGAMALASGAIRLRMYSRWGLSLLDVAKICFLVGLTFWLGNIAVLGLGMVYRPEAAAAVDRMPAAANQAIGLAALAALAVYLAWVSRKPRALGYQGASVRLPSGAMTLIQIGIAWADLGCCSTVMYLLIPATPAIGFVPLAVVVVFGTLLGFASHAPGAIGPLDMAMLVGLPGFDPAELVAALLLYRLLYFVAPFAIALAGLSLREGYVYLHDSQSGARGQSRAESAPPSTE
jgi:uncharacterized membrane protein YbhN (UPF0104 family)